jgi:hypothetical protein
MFGRGLAKIGKGDRTGGGADIAAAKAIQADITEEFARYGVVVPAGVEVVGTVPAAKPGLASAATTDCSRAETHWKSAEDIKSLEVYQDHLARFPQCEFAALARARVQALKK